METSRFLIETLPALQRLALSYAPAFARGPTLNVLALDARMAGVVRSASEPMLAQIRLAWWREMLQRPSDEWPDAEPLVTSLRDWQGDYRPLAGLIDGWEAMTAAPPLSEQAIAELANARAGAFAALADNLGCHAHKEIAERFARNWAAADIVSGLSDPSERSAAWKFAQEQDWRRARLPQALRPLTVLHGLAVSAVRRGKSLDALSAWSLAAAMRLGLLGR